MRNTVRTRITELGKIPRRMYRGFLAFPYDGIGMYCYVTMSRSSTSSAIRARVASGDFASGRIFPEGTDVVLVSNRGQLEVITLGNIGSAWVATEAPAPPEDCGITDTFTRTVASGWGTSDSTLPWQVFDTNILPGSGFSVDGSVGSATLVTGDGTSIGSILYTAAASMLMKLRFTGDGTTDDRLTFKRDPGTGVGSDPGGIIFYSDGEVYDGSGVHSAGFSLGSWFWFRAEGGNYRIWADGSSEPSSWTAMMSGYVAGRISFDATHGGASSWLLEIDSLDITGVDRCTQS